MKQLLTCLLILIVLPACQQAPRQTQPQTVLYTSTKIGSIQKQYGTRLDAFKEVVRFDGGDIESRYLAAVRSYEQGTQRYDSANYMINRVDQVAQKLLSEWEQEIEQYSNQARQADSRARYDAARKRHEAEINELRSTQAAMKPVLVQMHDLVLYLRHRLNEVALNGVPVLSDEIDGDIQNYLDSINDAILKAEGFVNELGR